MSRKKILMLILVCIMSLGIISCDKNEANKENVQNETQKVDSSAENAREETKNTSKKKVYIEKLNDIENGLSDLDSLYAGNTIEMKAAAEEEWTRWDKALNEIYKELKNDLPEDKFKELEKEEVQWIKDRDKKAKQSSLELKGGTAEQLAYTSSLAESTKERCYELVNKYME